ncbi:GNAT family N-acetyltransferase [Microbulbifer sediminum]|uniref:GNAT family N-acetyltransferase n=1 Tax=Microbulbifer sediminum TaxID=2904250 RepID=UPI001F19B798|nr:GNAT family N-acetyltransferase [Microbulbifer sediminum]
MNSHWAVAKTTVTTTDSRDWEESGISPDGRSWYRRGSEISCELGAGRQLKITLDMDQRRAFFSDSGNVGVGTEAGRIDSWIDWLFAHYRSLESIVLDGNLVSSLGKAVRSITRARFFQDARCWYRGSNGGRLPLEWAAGEVGSPPQPLRPAIPAGEVFRRHCHELGMDFSLRRIDPALDTRRFVDWMNQPRVAEFWEEEGNAEKQRRYIDKVLAAPHKDPLIASFDDRPFAYFELYWAMEDRLGEYYDAQPFDRGLHLLVGDPAFLGRHYAYAWLDCIFHFMFLDDTRTTRLVGEPRADNRGILKYVERMPGWRKVKEFDFPHKRAALVMGERDAFFQGMAGGDHCD